MTHGHYRSEYACGHPGPSCACAPDDLPATRLSRDCFACVTAAVETEIKNSPRTVRYLDTKNRDPDPIYHDPRKRGPKIRKVRSDKGVPRPHRRKKEVAVKRCGGIVNAEVIKGMTSSSAS